MKSVLRATKTASLLAASLVVATITLSSCALPPLPAATPAPATVEASQAQIAAEVMQAERDLNNASDMKGDYEAALKFHAKDFITIDNTGKVSDREAALSWVKDGLYKGESTTWDDVKIRVYGNGNVAVFTAIVHFKGLWEGKPLDLRQRATDVWVKQDGQWQMVSQHSSNL
jgi:ketosteroid isomerase-like protein